MSLPSSPSALVSKHKKLAINIEIANQNTSLFSYVSPKNTKSLFDYSEISLIQQQAMHRQLQQKAILLKQKEKKLKSTLRQIQKTNPSANQVRHRSSTSKGGHNKHKRSQTFDFAINQPAKRSSNTTLSRIPSVDSLESNDKNKEINLIYKCLGDGIEKQNKQLAQLHIHNTQHLLQIKKLKHQFEDAKNDIKQLREDNILMSQQLSNQREAYSQLLLELKEEQSKKWMLQVKLNSIQQILINPQALFAL